MADSIGLEAIKRIARTLASAVEEARNDPLTAAGRYARGAVRSTAEGLEPIGKVYKPAALPIAALKALGTKPDDTGGDGRPSIRADSAAEQVGAEMGIPSPSSGGQKVAREAFERVTDKRTLGDVRHMLAKGMDPEEMWARHGLMRMGREVYRELPGEPKVLRSWNANETRARLGDVLDWPEMMDALRRAGLQDPEKIQLQRIKGGGGYAETLPFGVKKIAVGDEPASFANTLYHELNHVLESLQSRRPGGADPSAYLDKLLSEQNVMYGNRIMTVEDAKDVLFQGQAGQPMYDKVLKLGQDAEAMYYNNPGEVRARVAAFRDEWLPEAARQEMFPLTNTPSPITVDSKGVATGSLNRRVGSDFDDAAEGMDIQPNWNANLDWNDMSLRTRKKDPIDKLFDKKFDKDLDGIISELLNAP